MAGNMDTRVVQLQFENREFERNIAQSTKSLEELKEAMDFEETSRGLSRFAEGFDFSRIEGNLQKLTDKFTGFGDAAEYVISRIRYSIESALRSFEGLVRSMSTAQISVGQGKYNEMNKSVMTIVSSGKATEQEAYDIMSRIMAYTDQTSHNFNTMVGQLSNLSSIGMDLNEAERLLEGIGNAATFAGQGADNAALAMSILSKRMSPESFIGYEQFLQLSNTARIVTDKWREQAIQAAVAVGTLTEKNGKFYTNVKGQKKGVEVTKTNLQDTLKYRWLTGMVQREMYKEYQFGDTVEELAHPEKAVDSFGKTAYLTGQRALTLADALNAVRETVSSGWMETFQLLWGDVSEAAEHFTNIADRLNEFIVKIQEFRNGILQFITERGGRKTFMEILLGEYEDGAMEGAIGILDILDEIGSVISKGFWDFILAINPGVMLSKAFSKEKWEGNAEYRMYVLSDMINSFLERIRDFFIETNAFFNEEIEVNGRVTTRLQMIHDIVSGIAGALGFAWNIAEEVFGFLNGIAQDLDPSISAVLDLFARLGAKILDASENAEQSGGIQKFFQDLRENLTPVTDGINEVIKSLTNLIMIILGLDDETEDAAKGAEDATKKNGTSILQLLLDLVKGVGKIVGPILTFFSKVIDAFTVFKDGFNAETLKEFGRQIGEGFSVMVKAIADGLPEGFGFIRDFIYDLFGLWEDEAKKKEREGTLGTLIHNLFTVGLGDLPGIIGEILGGTFNLTDALDSGLGITSAINWVGQVLTMLKQANLTAILNGFLGTLTVGGIFAMVNQLRDAFKKIKVFFDDVGGNLAHGMSGEYEWFGERMINIVKALGIVVLAVIALSAIPTGKLLKGIVALGVIMGMMYMLFRMLSPDTADQNATGKNGVRGGDMMRQAAVELQIITLAGAIVAIVAAVSVLMLAMVPLMLVMKDWGGFARAMLTFIILLGGIGAFMKIMMTTMQDLIKKMGGRGKGSKWKGLALVAGMMFVLAAGMVLIAAAVAVLSIAMTPFAIMSWGGLARGIVGLLAILVIFGSFITVMLNVMNTTMKTFKKRGGSDWAALAKIAAIMTMLSVSMIAIAAASAVFALAMVPFAIMSWGGLARGVVGLLAILTLAGTFITVMLTVMKKNLVLFGGGASGKHDFKALAKIAIVMITLSAIMIVLAAAVGVFVTAMTPFAVMNWGGLARGIIGLFAILTLIGTFITVMLAMMKKNLVLFGGGASGKHDFKALAKIALTLIVLAGSMALIGFAVSLITLAILPMAAISFDGLINALIGLGAILAIMIGVMATISKVKTDNMKLTSFIGFALSIAILMYSLKFVADLREDQYIRGITALITVMLSLVILMAIMKEMQPDLKTAGSTLLMLIGLGAGMLLFAIAFNEVKDIPWQTMVAFAGSISALLIAVAVAGKIANGIGIKGVLIAVIGLAAVLAVIALMAPMLINGIATALAEASGQLILVATMMQTFSNKMSGVDEGALDKTKRIVSQLAEILVLAGGFAFFGSVFVNLTEAISQLTLISGLMVTMVSRFDRVRTDSITSMTLKIMQLQALLIGPLAEFGSYLQDAKDFSSVMYELGTGIEIFDNHTKNLGLDPENNPAVKTIQALANCANDLDVIAKMDIDSLSAKITGLGGAMILYAQGAKEATGMGFSDGEDNSEGITAAVDLMRKITSGLAEEGGIVLPEAMPDEDSIGLFGAQIAALAAALIQFEQAGAGLGTGKDKALETLTFFQELKQKLVDTQFDENLSAINVFGAGEEAKAKTGELETFGKNIEQLGLSLGQFANSTTYLDEGTGEIKTVDYSNATKALEDIAGVADKLPKFGGALTILTGEKENLTKFAGELEALGQALNDFHTNTSTMDAVNGQAKEYDYSNAVATLTSIASIPSQLPNYGGVIALWEGDPPSLTKLAGDIVGLGAGLQEFSKSVVGDGTEENPGVDPTVADPVIEIVDKMVDFMEKIRGRLGTVGGLSNFFSTIGSGRKMDLTDLGNQIGGMGDGLSKFGEGISGKFGNVDEVLNALSAVSNIVEIMAALSNINDNQFYGDYTMAAQGLVEFLETFSEGFTNGFGERIEHASALESIVTLMKSVSDEIDEIGDIKIENLSMFDTLSSALAHLSSIDPTKLADFENTGMSIATGIATGIEKGTSIVTEAAVKLATETYNATMDALKAASPSKVFTDVGSYIGLGMAIGIDESSKEVVDSATGMTEKTIETAGTLAGAISRILEESSDINPTISPVLDLTEVENGVSILNGMFGSGSYGLSLNGKNMTISTENASSEATQPKDYTDSIGNVNSELNNLRKDIQNLAEAMSNIKMVMNTGAVVGAIGPDIDRFLGERGFYSARTSM